MTHPDCIDRSEEHLLDSAEHSRAKTFKFFKDRKLYIAAHIFLRQKLSEHAPVSPAEWQFTTNTYGKPAIANSGYKELRFNLSHTQGLIACAVSHQQEVGIDVEKRKKLMDFDALCRYAFSTSEATDVLSINKLHMKEQRFFTYWTLKEAYIKARGMGLSIPLQKFTFTENENKEWNLHCDAELEDDGKNWHFSTHVFNEHHLAIGVQMNPPDNSATDSPIRMCKQPFPDCLTNVIKLS